MKIRPDVVFCHKFLMARLTPVCFGMFVRAPWFNDKFPLNFLFF